MKDEENAVKVITDIISTAIGQLLLIAGLLGAGGLVIFAGKWFLSLVRG